MVSVTIRNVPEASRDRLAERAERAGQSLQEYLRALIVTSADQPTVAEILDAVQPRMTGSTVTAESILDALRADRR